MFNQFLQFFHFQRRDKDIYDVVLDATPWIKVGKLDQREWWKD